MYKRTILESMDKWFESHHSFSIYGELVIQLQRNTI
jgi:hypothetical protein